MEISTARTRVPAYPGTRGTRVPGYSSESQFIEKQVVGARNLLIPFSSGPQGVREIPGHNGTNMFRMSEISEVDCRKLILIGCTIRTTFLSHTFGL